jgi:two-component system, cell cycle response regulator
MFSHGYASINDYLFFRRRPRRYSLRGTLLSSLVIFSLSMTILKLLSLNKQLFATNHKLEALAMVDSLTNLPNQRSLIAALDQELERAYRYDRICSILFLDIDCFKAINDTYGHVTGDKVLKEFAGVLRLLLRRADTMGRWGGEEFLVILPETEEAGAQATADRIRITVAKHLFISESAFHLTCSIGSATYHPSIPYERERLIALADQAMYAAKSHT